MTTLYDFTVFNMANEPVELSCYKNKVVLIVNTATACGLTPQYESLQQLYEQFNDSDFEILDFPCNQFKQQAKEDIATIDAFCTLNFHTTFPRFAKIDVNGKTAIPLYQWLQNEKRGLLGKKIEWNFTKFLIDRNGHVVERFSATSDPLTLKATIEKYL